MLARLLVVLAILLLAGCATAPANDPPAAGGEGAATSADPPPTASSSPQQPTPTQECGERCACPYLDGCGVPPFDAAADVRFVLNDSYASGSDVDWIVENVGSRDYSAMAPTACSIAVHSEAGRRIWMGPCYTDFVQATRIPAGGTADLGSWPAGECVRDERQWYAGRCAEWRPLPPGTYEVRRTFCAYGESHREDCSTTSSSGARLVLV